MASDGWIISNRHRLVMKYSSKNRHWQIKFLTFKIFCYLSARHSSPNGYSEWLSHCGYHRLVTIDVFWSFLRDASSLRIEKSIDNVLVKNKLRTSKQSVIVYHFINGLPIFVSSSKRCATRRERLRGKLFWFKEAKEYRQHDELKQMVQKENTAV